MKIPLSKTACATLAAFLFSAAGAAAIDIALADEGSPATALVPNGPNGGATLTTAQWTGVADPPNQANWIAGTLGVGYDEETNPALAYDDDIGLDVDAVMNGQNQTCYVRVPFNVTQATLNIAQALILNMKYDDGFVAYVNGTEVLRMNAPLALPFNAGADGNHEAGDDFESFDISAFLGTLQVGDNMLAIHGLNDGLGSSDFLVLPQLVISDNAPPVWPSLRLGTPVITGLVSPVDIAHAGDGSGRLFIVERAGRVRIWNGTSLSTFLDIRSRVSTTDSGGDERGLLGIAFPPDFAQKDYFYVSYISNQAGRSNDSVVARIDVNPNNPNDAIEASETEILWVNQPNQTNHNGGQIQFGHDGMLYFGLGDGGGGGDNHGTVGNGQEPTTMLGKMVRIDVEGVPDPGLAYAVPPDNPFVATANVPNEVWAFGLRNPWRFSFDRKTGDLYIADVGQGEREEVNFAPASSPGGENYQWRRLEGFASFNLGTPLTNGISTDPIFDYPNGSDQSGGLGRSITGGYVYRGSNYPRMEGVYFVGDYSSGRIWGVQRNGQGVWLNTELDNTSLNISSFGEDEAGNLYVASLFSGVIHELTDTQDSGYLKISDSNYNGLGTFTLTFGTEIGKSYQLQFSTDGANWQNFGPLQVALGLSTTLTGTLPGAPVRAFVRGAQVN